MSGSSLARFVPSPLVAKFYLYMATTSNAFLSPITVIYMLSQGVNYTQVGIVQSLFWAGMIGGEVPTGYLGDRLGRRYSLLLSTLVIAAVVVGFGFADGFYEFAAVYLLWAVGVTFRSGSLGAWLYDALEERLNADEFSRVRGRGNSIVLAVSAVGSLVGGYLYTVDTRLPFFATGILAVIGFVVLLTFPTIRLGDEDEDGGSFTFLDSLRVVREELAGRQLRWFLLYAGLIYVTQQVVNVFIQPASLEVGASVEQIGFLYAGFNGLAAVASYFTGFVKDRVGVERWFLLAPLLMGLPLLAVVASPLLVLPAIVGVRLINQITSPLRNQYINDRTPSRGRATILSAASMFFGLLAMPARIGAGGLADATSLLNMFVVLGGALLVGAVTIRYFVSPFEPSTATTPETAD